MILILEYTKEKCKMYTYCQQKSCSYVNKSGFIKFKNTAFFNEKKKNTIRHLSVATTQKLT